jgi:DNA-binding beta-propeller fold protein YncE
MRLFFMIPGRARVRLVQAGAAFAAAALIAGCGNSYRPVVTPINPSGPAAQPASYAAIVSAPSPTSAGIVTIVDYSGDTVMAIAPIGPGPRAFVMDQLGSTGYTLDSDGTIANFPISTSLQSKNVVYSTVSSTAAPINLLAPTSGLWLADQDLNGNATDVFTGSPEAFKLAIPVAATPVAMIGTPDLSGQREYAISQNNASDTTGVACNLSPTTAPTGLATPIEISTYTADATIALGRCPVYGVLSSDQKRLFVMNRGSDSITVIDTQRNALDSCTPFQNQNGQWVTCHDTIQLPTGSGPVYGEYNKATNQLVVANYDGGTISVIDVGLDEYGYDSNTYTNSSCTTYADCGAITGGFGTTYTIPVGKNPASVTVLYDGSRAYAANQTDGTVTIANISSHTVEKTLTVVGHPRTVVSTQNSLYGKVYVASPDSPYVTILATLTDLVDTTVLVEGNVVDVRVSTQNGSSGNTNVTSRVPGFGQPCNLPPALMISTYGANYTLAECQATP